MSLFNTPYPKSSFKLHWKVSLLISLSIVFVLTVLQPFGTESFKHEYKFQLLSGYGLVVFASGLIYYIITSVAISDHTKDRWTIVNEVVFLFFNVLFSFVACYLYYSLVFSSTISFSGFFEFLFYAGSVALIPVAAYLGFLYFKYKEVTFFVENDNGKDIDNDNTSFVLSGSSEKDKVKVDLNDLLYIKSSDNYVIVHLLADGKITKKMLRNTLNQIHASTGEKLIKCHRSYLVNTAKIINIEGNITNSKLSLMGTDTKIPVSRSNVDTFRKIAATD